MEKTLEQKLEELKNKIDECYSDRIEKAASMKAVDLNEARAIEMIGTIDRVIDWARTYEVN